LAVVRKSEFARLANVSKGRVTQWITAGHISGAAIVGEGRTAMIDVELAMAQLKERLSVDERFGLNGLGTNLDPTSPQKIREKLVLNGPGTNLDPAAPVPEPVQSRVTPVRVIPEGETEGTV